MASVSQIHTQGKNTVSSTTTDPSHAALFPLSDTTDQPSKLSVLNGLVDGRRKNPATFGESIKHDETVVIVERDNIEGPTYDGPIGYNVLRIRLRDTDDVYKPLIDAGTLLLKGQFRLLGVYLSSFRLIVGSLHQVGAGMFFERFFILDMKTGEQIPITEGDRQEYRFAAITPDQQHLFVYQWADEIEICKLSGNGCTFASVVAIDENTLNLPENVNPLEMYDGSFDLTGDQYHVEWSAPHKGIFRVTELVYYENEGKWAVTQKHYSFELPKN